MESCDENYNMARETHTKPQTLKTISFLRIKTELQIFHDLLNLQVYQCNRSCHMNYEITGREIFCGRTGLNITLHTQVPDCRGLNYSISSLQIEPTLCTAALCRGPACMLEALRGRVKSITLILHCAISLPLSAKCYELSGAKSTGIHSRSFSCHQS